MTEIATYQYLQVAQEGKVATVTLNRAEKRNALSIAVRNEIDDCFAKLEDDATVSVVLFASKGPVFCAGFDLKEFGISDAEQQVAFSDSSARYHKRIIEFSKPLVAAVQGPAMGGGFDLAVMCDIRIATPDATFAHPEIKFGAPVLFGPLKEIIGGGLARDLCLTGRKVDAGEAYRIGLVSRVVDADDLMSASLETANAIAEAPVGTLKIVKKQIVDSFGGWDSEANGGGLFAFAG